MTNDEKIAVFAGFRIVEHCPCGENCSSVEDKDGFIQYTPDYTTSDSDAISLLPVLVARGYEVRVGSDNDKWLCVIWSKSNEDNLIRVWNINSIAQAISEAVLELIKNEVGNAR